MKISAKLVEMLNAFPKEEDSQKVRKPEAAEDTLPHVKTLESHDGILQDEDILHVMNILGHKNIKNTLIYTHLVKFEKEDDFICKVAKTPKEIRELIEAGFEYVYENNGLLFFRKRK